VKAPCTAILLAGLFTNLSPVLRRLQNLTLHEKTVDCVQTSSRLLNRSLICKKS